MAFYCYYYYFLLIYFINLTCHSCSNDYNICNQCQILLFIKLAQTFFRIFENKSLASSTASCYNIEVIFGKEDEETGRSEWKF